VYTEISHMLKNLRNLTYLKPTLISALIS